MLVAKYLIRIYFKFTFQLDGRLGTKNSLFAGTEVTQTTLKIPSAPNNFSNFQHYTFIFNFKQR